MSVPPPSKHQLAVMIWLAVFPTLVLLNLTIGRVLGDLAVVPRTFVLATVAVPIVIYGLMPHLHRLRARLLAKLLSLVEEGRQARHETRQDSDPLWTRGSEESAVGGRCLDSPMSAAPVEELEVEDLDCFPCPRRRRRERELAERRAALMKLRLAYQWAITAPRHE